MGLGFADHFHAERVVVLEEGPMEALNRTLRWFPTRASELAQNTRPEGDRWGGGNEGKGTWLQDLLSQGGKKLEV